MLDRRKIEIAYQQASRRIKDFLLSDKSREFFLFLFFCVVAGGFWLLQTLNYDYETEFSMPVKLKGVPDNIVITQEPVNEVRVKVKDKGTVLLNYMLGKSFFPINLKFAESSDAGSHVQVLSALFEKSVLAQLNASTRLLSIKPDTLEYYYAAGKSKRVPVKLQGTVSSGREYYLSDTIFTPDSVWVYAPQAVLDTITAAYTTPIVAEDVSDTLQCEASLQTAPGVKLVPSLVKLALPVDIYTEKTVEVPLHGVNFPANRLLRAFPSKIQITFQVGLSRFRQITADDFYLSVSYEELRRLGSDKYTVKLNRMPQGISHVRFNPPQVDFLIEQIAPGDYED